MTTDPYTQRIYDDGYDEAIEDINMLIEQLTVAWGCVAIACNGGTCAVWGGNEGRVYQAPTLLEALRIAAGNVEPQP